jgi:hypothetical protein
MTQSPVSTRRPGKFVYNRGYPPLFFAPVTWPNLTKHLRQVRREFFRRVRRETLLRHSSPLSNGMTCGEMCMWILAQEIKPPALIT